ncbi:hypothetical protein NMY22_g14572 [Coprinellus aureogranulatus]|nr:hypothetical protein NMY22_g14572 [Coprinellus aureogranulatus]
MTANSVRESFASWCDRPISSESAAHLSLSQTERQTLVDWLKPDSIKGMSLCLEVAFLGSPILLLQTFSISKQKWLRESLLQTALALGNDKPPPMIDTEGFLFEVVFDTAFSGGSCSHLLSAGAQSIARNVAGASPTVSNWFVCGNRTLRNAEGSRTDDESTRPRKRPRLGSAKTTSSSSLTSREAYGHPAFQPQPSSQRPHMPYPTPAPSLPPQTPLTAQPARSVERTPTPLTPLQPVPRVHESCARFDSASTPSVPAISPPGPFDSQDHTSSSAGKQLAHLDMSMLGFAGMTPFGTDTFDERAYSQDATNGLGKTSSLNRGDVTSTHAVDPSRSDPFQSMKVGFVERNIEPAHGRSSALSGHNKHAALSTSSPEMSLLFVQDHGHPYDLLQTSEAGSFTSVQSHNADTVAAGARKEMGQNVESADARYPEDFNGHPGSHAYADDPTSLSRLDEDDGTGQEVEDDQDGEHDNDHDHHCPTADDAGAQGQGAVVEALFDVCDQRRAIQEQGLVGELVWNQHSQGASTPKHVCSYSILNPPLSILSLCCSCHCRWVFWFRQQRSPGNKVIDYEEGIKKISAFSSVESFWSLWTHLSPPSALQPTTDYLLFHSAIRRPVWEDPLNITGGKWIIRLRKGVADRLWEDLVLAVIGDLFDECRSVVPPSSEDGEGDNGVKGTEESGLPEICGCTISGYPEESAQLPPSTIMEYKTNTDSMTDKSSFRNSAIDRTPLS